MASLLKMKKLDLRALQEAARGVRATSARGPGRRAPGPASTEFSSTSAPGR
jgi:hypothetical protein